MKTTTKTFLLIVIFVFTLPLGSSVSAVRLAPETATLPKNEPLQPLPPNTSPNLSESVNTPQSPELNNTEEANEISEDTQETSITSESPVETSQNSESTTPTASNKKTIFWVIGALFAGIAMLIVTTNIRHKQE